MPERVVLITGGARGIGYGIAECFTARGARLVIADLDPDAVAEQINSRGAVASSGVRCAV